LSLQLVKLFGAPMVILGYKPSIIIFPEKVKGKNLAFLFLYFSRLDIWREWL
jgi:hypothetical protein